jgi:anti-anti-sigma regulatory factor
VKISACGLSDHYREIFEITRLSDFMTITDTEDGAMSAADGRDDA